MRHDRTMERKSVNSLKDLRSLVAPGQFPRLSGPHFNLKNTIDGERDSVKVAVYKFLSDHLECPVAGVVDALKGHGYERNAVVCAINMLVNEGCLASHRYGSNADSRETGVRLIEGKRMPEVGANSQAHKPGVYRSATTVSHHNGDATLSHRDGVETALWKAMQDHVPRTLETVVEIVRVAGFSPGIVKGEIMLLEQRGWVEIDRSGGEPTCRLKEDIKIPSKRAADVSKPQQETFDPMQPAEPGSLLEKVQQAQLEMGAAARSTHHSESRTVKDEPGKYVKKVAQDWTGRKQICQLLASGQHMTTMEIYSALRTRSLGVSKSRTYELIRMLHQDGALTRDGEVPHGVNAAYRYWLTQPLPAMCESELADAEERRPDLPSDTPLVISARLRGVELTLQECGELLREVSGLWFLKGMHDPSGLIQSRFTVKGVELSLVELLDVATYLADAATYFGCVPRHQDTYDDIFPDQSPAA